MHRASHGRIACLAVGNYDYDTYEAMNSRFNPWTIHNRPIFLFFKMAFLRSVRSASMQFCVIAFCIKVMCKMILLHSAWFYCIVMVLYFYTSTVIEYNLHVIYSTLVQYLRIVRVYKYMRLGMKRSVWTWALGTRSTGGGGRRPHLCAQY